VARSKCETRLDNTDKEGVKWVILWEDNLIFKLAFFDVLVCFYSESLEVFLEFFTYLILGEVELDPPHIHIVFEEFYGYFVFEF
jgi:hypothetical protein